MAADYSSEKKHHLNTNITDNNKTSNTEQIAESYYHISLANQKNLTIDLPRETESKVLV